MVLQDKLKVSLKIQNKIIEIPINETLSHKVIFRFNEHEIVSLQKSGKAYKVEVECFNYCVDDEVKHTNNSSLVVGTKNEYYITDPSHKELGYEPGLYKIDFIKENGKIEAYFVVDTNKQVSELGLEKIKDNLEKLKPGLAYDKFRPGRSVIYVESYENIINLIKNWERIKLGLIGKVRVEVIESELKYQFKLGKSNFKSIRKELIKPKDKFLNVVKTISFNSYNETNIYKNKLIDLIKRYEEKINNELALASNYKIKLENQINELEILDNSNQVNVAHINEVKSLQQDLNDINQSIDLTNLQIKQIEEIKRNLNNNNFLDDKLRELYTRLNINKEVKIANKSTSLLFELYGFVISYNVLTDLGFTCLNLSEFRKLQNVTSNTSLIFTKNNIKVKLIYENFVKHYTEASNNELACVITNHNKPDFTLMFYKNDKYLTSLIIEIKYRNANYVFTNKYDAIVETTDNYSLLVYKEDNQIRRNAVKEVILINPSKEENIFTKGVATTYIGYNLDKEYNESMCYEYLKKVIHKII